jgi:L-ascorbate metabolism protein UlaG (beta-lactamase superfamily)
MALWGKLYKIDLALLPIGGVFTMDAAQAAMTAMMLRCKKVVPMHWGTFPVLDQNVDAFRRELEKLELADDLMQVEVGVPVGLVR